MNDPSPAQKLAAAILEFDEANPGDPEATVEVPFDVWAEWINLAGQVDTQEDFPP